MRQLTSKRCALAMAGMFLSVALLARADAQESQRIATAPSGPYRALAPGVEITIAPDRQEKDTFSTHDIIEILQGIPGLEESFKLSPSTRTLRAMATETVFRRDIWCLEFTFKPVRMLSVDVPQANGGMRRKLIWYLVYHVKNTGRHLQPVRQEDGSYAHGSVDRDVRFFPTFVLEAHEYGKQYLDRIIPAAALAIQQKEDPNRTLLNSVDVGSKKIAVSDDLIDRSVWGVATWEDVDPRVDYFSIYVQGLSNAYQWSDAPGGYKPGDPPGTGRMLLQKTLMLNFWRPGDEYAEDKRMVRFGIPGKVDYSWVYR